MNDIGVIHATNGGFSIVDANLLPALSKFSWNRMPTGYFYRNFRVGGKHKIEYLHRHINKTPSEMVTDHKNGFRNDNRILNLRTATSSQNIAQNIPKHRDSNAASASKYKGVQRVCRYGVNENKWRAKLKRKDLGVFLSESEAAKAYNVAASAEYGEFAFLNKIEESK